MGFLRAIKPGPALHRSVFLLGSLLLASGLFPLQASARMTGTALVSPARHVFVLVLENESYPVTFGNGSLAPYMATTLPKQGALLTRYYGIGHSSLDNYIAMISGQAPNPATQSDYKTYIEFTPTGAPDALSQVPGSGCVYPSTVKTVVDQLAQVGLSWKGYMEDMGASPMREASTCGHVALGSYDETHKASASDEYADKHDPLSTSIPSPTTRQIAPNTSSISRNWKAI